jgi:hypothetical protein
MVNRTGEGVLGVHGAAVALRGASGAPAWSRRRTR